MGTRNTAEARHSRPRTASPTRACPSRSGSRSGRRITSATSGTCTIASIRAAPCTPDGLRASPPTRMSRSVSSTARRASGRSSLVLRRAVFVALIALGAGSLLFDLTIGFRLPSDADWAEAAGSLRSRARPGDAVQIWPVWAERARLFVDAAPVLAEEDLEHADYLEVRRLWVLSLPRTPFFRAPDPALRARGATAAGEVQRFGALALQAWGLHAAALAADPPRAPEEHEVDYVARRCPRVPPRGPPARP